MSLDIGGASVELQRLTACETVVLVNVREREEFTARPGHLPVLSTCRWPIYQAGPTNLPPDENRSCWFARLTV
jgi:hypothetical protein